MHISFLTHEYPPSQHGGVGIFIQTMAYALANRGHTVTVIGIYPINTTKIEVNNNINIIRIPKSRKPTAAQRLYENTSLLNDTIRTVNSSHPIDIIEGSEMSFAFVSPLLEMPKLIRMHGGHHFFSYAQGQKTKFFRRLIERISLTRADYLCGVSNYVATTTQYLLNLNKPIEILPNPVNTTLFQPKSIVANLGQIIYIGTLTRKKGVFELMQAMPLVLREIPNARLRMIGRDNIDPITKQSTRFLLEMQMSRELMNRVDFVDHVAHEELPDLLAEAQVCVFPSHMEAMPLSWIEALSMGKAVVASKLGPGPEVIEHGKSGLLCDPHNPQSIAEQVIRLLKDDELRDSLGKIARNRALEEYSIDVLVERNERFYTRLIK